MKPSYEELLKDYRDLQLRVTRFSAVEQQLINTRDSLDHELELYKRLNQFTSKIIQENSDDEFASLVAEAIVDIFELEGALVLVKRDDKHPEKNIFVKEGIHLSDSENESIKNEFTSLLNKLKDSNNLRLAQLDVTKFDSLRIFDDMIFSIFSENEKSNKILFAGVITNKKKEVYIPLETRKETIFKLFANQVHAQFSNRNKALKIQEQIKKILDSEIELKKLSLIATKTKNGVIITDRYGCIEWVNDSFVDTTGYTLEEVRGRKPKDFLQRKEKSDSTIALLSDALKRKETIEVTIENYTKSGNLYYNQLEITPVFDEQGKHINFIALQKDITSEIMFQKELMRANSRFELITQKTDLGIWEWEVATNQTNWNDVLIKQYGLENIPENANFFELWMACIHPEDRESIVKESQGLIESSEDILEQSYRIMRQSDKQLRHVKSLTVYERDAQGKLIRMLGSSLDITDSMEAQAKLQASERKYRDIIENMNLGLAESDVHGHLVFNNSKFDDICKNRQPERILITKNPQNKLENSVEAGEIAAFEILDERNYEIKLIDELGIVRYYLVSTGPIINERDITTGYINIFLDITSVKNLQKNLENALKERNIFIDQVNSVKLFYESILNHSPAKIAVINPNNEVIYANELLIQKEPWWSDSEGKTLNELISSHTEGQRSLSFIREQIEISREKKKLIQVEECRIKEALEEEYILRNILPFYNSRGELEHVIISGINITELKKFEKDILNKNEELKKINAELDNFVYSVSHDLRSPLVSIKGIVHQVLKSTSLDDKSRNYLQLAEASVMRLDGTIQEILEYSRNARLDVDYESIELKSLVETIFDDLRFSVNENFEFRFISKSDTNTLESDKYRLTALLKNIISNAVKYANLDQENPFVHVEFKADLLAHTIIISDNGQGIPKESLDKIFNMFYRATNTSQGTGLGLYICQEIITKLEGKISVGSELNKGTTITINLPNKTTNHE